MGRTCWHVFLLLAALILCSYSQLNGGKETRKPLILTQVREGPEGNSCPKSEIFNVVEGEWKDTSDENARTKVRMKTVRTSHREYHEVKFDREDFLKRHTIHQRSSSWKTGPLDRATIQTLENKLYQNYESLRKQGRPPLNITNSTIHVVSILDDADWKTFNNRLDSYETEINADKCVEFTYVLETIYHQYQSSHTKQLWSDKQTVSKEILDEHKFAIVSRKGPGNGPTVKELKLPQLNSSRTIAFKPAGSGLEVSVAVSNSAVLVPVIARTVNIRALKIAKGKFQDFTIGLVLDFTEAKEDFGLKQIHSEKPAKFQGVSDENGKIVLTCPEGTTEAAPSMKNNRLACNARETKQGLECFGNSNVKKRRTLRKRRELQRVQNQVWKQPKHQQRYLIPSSDAVLVAEIMEDLKNGDHVRKTALGLRKNVLVGPMTLLSSLYNMNQREKAKGNSTLGRQEYMRGINVNDAIRERDPSALAMIGARYFGLPATQSLLRGGPAIFARALLLVGNAVAAFMGEPAFGLQALLQYPSADCSSNLKEGASSGCERRDSSFDWPMKNLEGSSKPSAHAPGPPQTPSIKLEELNGRVFSFKSAAFEDQLLLEGPEGYLPLADETKELRRKKFVPGNAESKHIGIQPRVTASNNTELLEVMREFLEEHSDQFWGYVRPAYEKFQNSTTVRNEAVCKRNDKLDFISIILAVTIVGLPVAGGIQLGMYLSQDQCELLKKFEDSRSYRNNIVDLGDFGLRHVELWSPDLSSDSWKHNLTDDDFFCPPAVHGFSSSAALLNRTSSVHAFKCVKALGYKTQEPSPELSAIIHLEVGNDTARGSQNSSNLFIVDDGWKDYEGGPFSDTFLVQGKPSGVLNGGDGEDVLEFSQDFQNKSIVEILIEDGVQVLKTSRKKKIQLKSIEVIRGRRDWMDLIYSTCNNTFIDGQSGRMAESDRIFLGSEACVRTTEIPGKLQIRVPPKTHVTNYNRDPTTEFSYFIVKSSESYSQWKRTITIEYSNVSSENHVRFEMSIEAAGLVTLARQERNEISLAIRSSTLDLDISFDYRNYRHLRMFLEHETEIVLVPTLTTINSPHSPMSLEPAFKLLLDTKNKSQVFGAKNNRNFFVFHFLRSSLENVTGGNLEDVFLFMKPTAVKALIGGISPDNTIELDRGLQGLIKFDFINGIMHSDSDYWDHSIRLVGNFTKVYGRWSESEEVIASCNVKIVDLKFQIPAPELGSALPEDTITIPDLTCPLGHHAVFHIYPSTKLVSRPAEGVFTYMVHRNNRTSGTNTSSIHVTIPGSATCLLSHKFLLLDHKPEDFTDIWIKDNNFKAIALGLNVSVTFPKDGPMCEDGTNMVLILSGGVSASAIKLPGRTAFELVFQFNLTLNDKRTVKGHESTSNVFLIRGNTARERIQGGEKDNLFVFGNHSLVALIDVSSPGNNYLEIAEDLQGKVVIDLHRNKIKWSSDKVTRIQGRVNLILGRKGGSESLETGCETDIVNLNGGTPDSWDQVLVPHLNCKAGPEKLTFEIHPYTNLTNSGSGTYIYRIVKVSPGNESETEAPAGERILDLSPLKEGVHFIEFEENAHEMADWHFDSSSSELKVQAQNLDLLVKLPKHGDPFARNHFFISKDNARILFKPRKSSDRLKPHVLWNTSNVVSGRDTIRGRKEYPNIFFLNSPGRLLNIVQGGDQNDEFILGPEAWIKAIDGGKGENLLVLQKSSQEISLPQKTIFGRGSNISLEGKFSEVHAEIGTSTTVIPDCHTEFIDLTQNFKSSGSSSPGHSSGGDSAANLVMIRSYSSCDYNLGIQLAPTLGTLWVLNGADRGRFKYFLPLVDSNITVYHVTHHSRDVSSIARTPESGFHYQFSLPVDLAQVSDIDHKSQNSYMTFDLLNGVRSTIQVLSVSSDKGLNELRKEIKSKGAPSGKERNVIAPPQNYILTTLDGFRILVNHNRIHDTMSTTEGSTLTDTRSYISDKCKIPNALSLTLTHRSEATQDGSEPDRDIQISGSDETDVLENNQSQESHLVANAGGKGTIFRIRPTKHNLTIYIYVPIQKETKDFEGNEPTNLMDWTGFYPIPDGVPPSSYRPELSIPTVVRKKDNLILTGLTSSSASPGGNQTVVYVDGVLSYKRMLVQLYTCRYEFHEYQNPNPDEKEEWLWALRITNKVMSDKPPDEVEPTSKILDEEDSAQVLAVGVPSRRRRSAQVNEQVYEFEEPDSFTDKDTSNNQIIVTSYADLVEYHQAGASIPMGTIAESGQETNETVFSLGESLVITNTLQEPTYLELAKRYFGFWGEPTTRRRTIVMVDLRSDMEKHNFTVALNTVESPGTETVAPLGGGNQVFVTHTNFTEFRSALKVAEDIANKTRVFNICMTILLVLLICFLILLLFLCCFKYRHHLKWTFFVLKRSKERKAARASKRPKVCKVVDPTSIETFPEGAPTSPSQVQYFSGRLGSKSMDSPQFRSPVSSDKDESPVFHSPATSSKASQEVLKSPDRTSSKTLPTMLRFPATSPRTSPEFQSAATSSRTTPQLQSPVLSAKALPTLQSTSGTILLPSPTSMDISLENRDESLIGSRRGGSSSPAVSVIELRPEDEEDTTLYKFICRIWSIPVYQSKKGDREDV